MRKILGRLGSDERHTFQAEFGKYGYKRYYDKSRGDLYSPTMVVRNVRIVDDPENPKMVTDHLWLNLTKGFANLGLLETGDLIQFNGRVSQYNKGFINKDKVDYELTYPSKVQLLVDKKTQPLPEDHRAQIGMIMNLNYKFYLNNQRPLVAYFMDSFAQWQKSQDTPLPIECHKGTDYENFNSYDSLDYSAEKEKLEKNKAEKQKDLEQRRESGLKILKENSDLVKDLVALGKELEQKSQDGKQHASEKYCYISNGKLRVVTVKYQLGKSETDDIRQALTTDWFHEKFNGKGEKQLSPLEQLAGKFNRGL